MIEPLDRTGTWRTYSTADGLPGVRIEHIAEDSEGYLWFATWENGASRYDGDEFRHFNLQDGLRGSRIYHIFEDSLNRLWFGTLNGVCWYDGMAFNYLDHDGIEGRAVQFIYEDGEGRIWCCGHRTLGYYEGNAFQDLIPLYMQDYRQPPSPAWSDQCRGIAQDPEGHLWFGFDYLIRFDGTSFYRYDERDGFPQYQNSYAVCRDDRGRVWFGQRQGSRNDLWHYTDGKFQEVQLDLGDTLRKIQCDREGRMWFCTTVGVLYDDGEEFNGFVRADGLPHSAVKAVLQDREHQLWFATWGGVGLYDSHSISVFDVGEKVATNMSEVSQIVQDRKGDIWIGYATPLLRHITESVFRFDGERFRCVVSDTGDINNCFAIYESHEGELWFGGINGLFRYDGRMLRKVKNIAGLGERGVCAIVQDSEGSFLFGHWKKRNTGQKKDLFTNPLTIIHQKGEHFQTVFLEVEDKDPFSRIGNLTVSYNGVLYFHLSQQNSSGADKGLIRYHPQESLRYYRVEDGLTDNRVTDLLEDRNGNLWIATLSGLCQFDGGTFRTFTTVDGLPSNRIHCLYEDSRGHIWLGTDGGVVHYDSQIFQTIKSPHIGPVCRILEDRNGTYWFGSLLGSIVRYRVRRIPPRIRMLQIIADQVYKNFEDNIRSTTVQQVIFEYKGLSFSTHPRDMLYTYRLKGCDADWRRATREMRAHYPDLPPGDYTFQVRAIDRDLNCSEVVQTGLSIAADPRIEAFTAVLNRRGSRKFIGHSAALRRFQLNLGKIASTVMTVLIMGETGTGKGLAARALHALSSKCEGPFVEVTCGALPGTLIDSELFGHEKGAFTSAVSHRLGRVELAAGGTIFLDEIGDMAVETQVKLLRLLEEGTYERVGSSETLTAQGRIVAATNRNLEEMVGAGAFREDLYYRLNAFPLFLPPLRHRKEDIPELAEYFKNRMAAHLGKQIDPITPPLIEILQSYDWPGNVRELEHAIQRAVVLCTDSQIHVEDLGLSSSRIEAPVVDYNGPTASPIKYGEIVPLNEYERRYILGVLEATNWRIKGARGAATLLGVPPSTLYGKIKKLGISSQRGWSDK